MGKRNAGMPMVPPRDLAHHCIHGEIGHSVTPVYAEPIHVEVNGHLTIETWVFRPYQHDHFRYQVDVVRDEWEEEYRVLGLYTQTPVNKVGPDGEPYWKWERECRVKVEVNVKPYRLPFGMCGK